MRRPIRFAAALLGACIALLAGAAVASAHVTVTAPGATRGGSDQEITFRVPVEKDVDTVGFTLALPTNTPIASVLVEPIAGWTHTQQTTKLTTPIKTDDGDITEAVSQITWTAQSGHGLTPGEFGAFTVIAGQLPDTPSITFRALQRYADGSTVAWNEVAAPGSSDEPENPAPVLTLASAAGTSGSAASASGSASASVAPVASSTSAGSSDTGPLVIAIIALVLAAAALALVVAGRFRRRTDA